jgi:hypothetical protein
MYAPKALEDNERYYDRLIKLSSRLLNLWMEQAQKPFDVPISNYQGASKR